MSEEQLSALLAKLREDAGFREKLKGAGDVDAAVALAKEAGFDVSKSDLLRHQARETLDLSDDELENLAGGNIARFYKSMASKDKLKGNNVCDPEFC
jgi:predicted ribosomally synthesized peptide with nif11-like leader